MTSAKSRKEQLEEKRRFWKQRIKDWQAGDLTQAEYCRKHHLKVHRFIYWKKKFHTPKTSPALVELKLPQMSFKNPTPVSLLRVSVNRFEVTVDRNFDPITLRQLIYTLEHV
jgi:hypothetical protein